MFRSGRISGVEHVMNLMFESVAPGGKVWNIEGYETCRDDQQEDSELKSHFV